MDGLDEFKKRPLVGNDYVTKPINELTQHPEYTPHALRVIMAILSMNTKEIEELTIARGPISGTT